MKFTDGYWQLRPGVEALYAQEAYDVASDDGRVTITAPTKRITSRGDTLNRPVLTVEIFSPTEDIIGVRVEHFRGVRGYRGFELVGAEPGHGTSTMTPDAATLRSGRLEATVDTGHPWNLRFAAGGRTLTTSGARSIGYFTLGGSSDGPQPARETTIPPSEHFVACQLDLGVGEVVYGLGERFGPVVKNGQTVDIWNADGGTSSEQAYKNVPFYLTNDGYGVFVNDTGHVSFEVGSEAVERVQFSVAGERLEYYVIYGPTPAEILERYTHLTGRPAPVPAWSYGLWLSTSFTTEYDEATVTRFVDEMTGRDLPLSVFHFDCFWMREFNWCDFEWDARTFPDPEGMLARLKAKGLRICVWINPYIAQRSRLFDEAADAGYLVKRSNGDVWQWDMWQAGMGLVDFTNPDATAWYQEKLRGLLGQGVDAFKTDFGERIPVDVEYFDGSDPARMHNRYAQIYNEAVYDVLSAERGAGEAVVFARAATTGGQRLPVHWGGDSTSTFESMAETLRGGLSLAMSGFAFWSHDVGGFEGEPDPAVFKRWLVFGLLSSHTRFHGSGSYRVPWLVDEESVTITREFTHLKLRLMPYLYTAGQRAAECGTPVLRPMQLEFPDDPAVAYLDRQYMLGPDLLVAPVMRHDGRVQFYLPAGQWTNYLTHATAYGPGWHTETHGFESLPLYVRDGAVLPLGARDDRPDYDFLDDLVLAVYPASSGGSKTVRVVAIGGTWTEFHVVRTGATVRVTSDLDAGWSIRVIGVDAGADIPARGGSAEYRPV